jgi:riboflavin biosynthesis pyrimidine reductase
VSCARSAAWDDLGNDARRRVLVAGENSVDVTRAVAPLRAQGTDRILSEGGPTLLDGLVDADAIVESCVKLAPKTRRQPARGRSTAVTAIRAGGDAAQARVGP